MNCCTYCGRDEKDCPGGIWRGGRNRLDGICIYCARMALRALGGLEPARVLPIRPSAQGRPDRRPR